MNVNNYSHQNNAQSFGMSLKLKNGAINKLSEIIQNAPNPDKMEQTVIKDILTPIQKSKTSVLVDDKGYVYLNDEANNTIKEILGGNIEKVGEGTLAFKTMIPNYGNGNILVDYKSWIGAESAKQEIEKQSGLIQKLTIARDIAKKYDREIALNTYSEPVLDNPTAQKLKELFG